MSYPKFDLKPSWKEMCEVISEHMEFRHRETGEVIKRTPQEVWESSPTGELFQIVEWYEDVAGVLEYKARVEAGEQPDTVKADMERRFKQMYQGKT